MLYSKLMRKCINIIIQIARKKTYIAYSCQTPLAKERISYSIQLLLRVCGLSKVFQLFALSIHSRWGGQRDIYKAFLKSTPLSDQIIQIYIASLLIYISRKLRNDGHFLKEYFCNKISACQSFATELLLHLVKIVLGL